VHITLAMVAAIDVVQEHNLGSPENPMSETELGAKFDDKHGAVPMLATRTSGRCDP
jgi:hypothetical protein